MTISQEQLKEKYDKLPEDVKSAMFSVGVEKELTAIGEKYNLHIDKIGELMEEVDLVMLGITNPKDFIRNLYSRFGAADKEQVRRVAHEVNERVFQKIRESLKEVHNTDSETQNIKNETNVLTPLTNGNEIAKEKITETKEEIAEKIEHPEKDEKDIVKEKLQKMNVMPTAESEYKINTDDQNKKKWSADPYREPVN